MKTIKPTIYEIAKKAGVSPATVSNVLNNRTKANYPRVAKRAEQIRSIARKMGYQINLTAKNLTQGKTHIVSINGTWSYFNNPTVSIFDSINSYAGKKLQEAGYNVLTALPEPDQVRSKTIRIKVDGAIVLQPHDEDFYQFYEESGTPYVCVNGNCGPNGSEILLDDADGTKKAMEHFFEMGHSRIAYFNVSKKSTHYSEKIRHHAYLQELQRRSFCPVSCHDAIGIDELEFLKRTVKDEKATAVLTYDFTGALKLLFAAKELGLSIPEDFSVICFNKLFPSEIVRPRFTVVDIPGLEIGEKASKILLRLMNEDSKANEACMVKEELVIRESVRNIASLS